MGTTTTTTTTTTTSTTTTTTTTTKTTTTTTTLLNWLGAFGGKRWRDTSSIGRGPFGAIYVRTYVSIPKHSRTQCSQNRLALSHPTFTPRLSLHKHSPHPHPPTYPTQVHSNTPDYTLRPI